MIRFGIISYAHPHALRYVPTINNSSTAEVYAISGDGSNSNVAKREAQGLKPNSMRTMRTF